MRASEFTKQGLAERKQSPLEDFEGLQFRMVHDNGQLFVNAFDSSGSNELGHVTFDIGDGKELDPQDLFVKEKFQGQGIARIMYDFVKSKGYKIQRSWDQTDAGAGFWDKHRGEERVWEQGVAEGSSHQHTEIIKHRVGDWIVYLDNHSVIRAMTRNIGPRMMSNLVTMVDMIPDLEDKVPKGGAFWIQDIKTNSSFYFKRLDIPSEPLAVRCETGVQDIPRANKQTPVFQVNAYTGPETKQAIQGMKQVKLRSKFVGTNTLANTLASNIQKGKLGGNDAIRNPATQDSKRYDTAFKQAQRMDKEVDENFADGKNPQDKGDSVRHGIPKNATMAELEKASHAAGRKGQLARWQLNMRRGHKK